MKPDDGLTLADRVCFYKVPDGSMIDQDRNLLRRRQVSFHGLQLCHAGFCGFHRIDWKHPRYPKEAYEAKY